MFKQWGQTKSQQKHADLSDGDFFLILLCSTINFEVTWCFTPNQPLWLYQGEISFEELS